MYKMVKIKPQATEKKNLNLGFISMQPPPKCSINHFPECKLQNDLHSVRGNVSARVPIKREGDLRLTAELPLWPPFIEISSRG